MQLERKTGGAAGLIMAAALALPGVAPGTAKAESAPEHGMIGMKYLNYKDWQPGLDRITVNAPSFYGLFPIAGKWAIEGSVTGDSVSGASPRWHTSTTSASKMKDFRKAMDLKVTRYWDRATFSVGAAISGEHDYVSRALSLSGTVSTEDNNRTWAFGLGVSHDSINPVNFAVSDAKKNTTEIMLGVTQVLTPQDIAQVNVTMSRGRGYFSDPYKFPDNRPDFRNQNALMFKWNHHLPKLDATTRLSYRYYSDSYGVKANTITGEWVQTLKNGWTLTPLIRLHSQGAASFYYDPVYDKSLGEPFPPGWAPGGLYSADQRLSAFGARTLGLKVSKALPDGWLVDLRYDLYSQSASYRLFGTGSPGLAPFNARFIQIGISKKLD